MAGSRPDAFRSGSSPSDAIRPRDGRNRAAASDAAYVRKSASAGLIDRSRAIRGPKATSRRRKSSSSARRGNAPVAPESQPIAIPRHLRIPAVESIPRLAVETRRRESDVCDIARRKTLRRAVTLLCLYRSIAG